MNGKRKFHKATGPAFNPGEQWLSCAGKIRCSIVEVELYPGAITDYLSDYKVIYEYEDGARSEKDAWNFQVRYMHMADKDL